MVEYTDTAHKHAWYQSILNNRIPKLYQIAGRFFVSDCRGVSYLTELGDLVPMKSQYYAGSHQLLPMMKCAVNLSPTPFGSRIPTSEALLPAATANQFTSFSVVEKPRIH